MKIITLQYSIESEGEIVEELHMRAPKVRDRLIAEQQEGSEAEKEMRFIANLCQTTPEVMMEMALSDYTKLQEAVNDFLS